jgi:formylglycine-generating enzyme required for sulfatase activity
VNEAGDYCRAVKGRLPTEVEWEYAARAGGPGSQDVWNRGNSRNSPHAVATKPPNAWGLYDMPGNVWEWTAGLPGSAEIRGGSYANDLKYDQVYARRPGSTSSSVGFRCARDE